VKVGDLIRFRDDWIHANHKYDKDGVTIDWEVITPRPDDEGWSDPVLVVERWEGMWICLDNGERIVVSPHEGLTAVEILSAVDYL
jgi:hypothetical protein